MARVARDRIALGLLNRHSRLHHRKAGHGAYAGAHWHTVDEVRRLFDRCKVPSVTLRFSIFLPDGGILAKMVEGFVPAIMPLGGFMLAIADWHGKKSIGSSARPRSSAVLD
jgi:hypothetical protein